jgi:polysaccharide deacetylase family protein (PEP-CTERM system associated)
MTTARVTFTLDLEDHRPDDRAEVRYPEVVDHLLDWLDERSVRGTIFVVGEVAEASPEVVKEVAARGHEIALHCWRHTPLTELDARMFREETARAKGLLEDLTGSEVVGYRAPTFSLVPSTLWAVDELQELGFTYSSSVLAGRNPLFGWPGAPGEPFRWPNGLGEFPVPVAGAYKLPFLGGTYLRLLPWPIVSAARRLARESSGAVPWTYTHPYDFDPGEPRWAVPDAGRLSPLLWVGRKGLYAKLDRLLDHGRNAGPPLGERLAMVSPTAVFP